MGFEIAVIGAGTAGLAVSRLLAEQGHHVDLFERSQSVEPVGAGILLQPTGQYVLKQMQLFEPVRNLASQINRLHGVNHRGWRVMDMRYQDLSEGSFGLGMHRHMLCATLLSNMPDNVTIHLGVNIERYAHVQTVNSMTPKVGAKVELLSDTGALGSCDVVIVASGANSSLRKQFPHVRYDREYPWGALWAIVENSNDNQHVLQQSYHYAHKMMGLLPCGKINAEGDALTSFFWSLPTRQYAHWREKTDFKQWKDSVVSLCSQAEGAMSLLSSKGQLVFAKYRDVVLRQPYDKQVIFIGDAAHSMSPQLGQGVNMALLDAWCLAISFATSFKSTSDIQLVFKHYQQQRHQHLRFYQMMSRILTPMFQSNNLPLAALRDALFYPMSTMPFFKQQTLATLAGVKTGVLSQLTLNM